MDRPAVAAEISDHSCGRLLPLLDAIQKAGLCTHPASVRRLKLLMDVHDLLHPRKPEGVPAFSASSR